MFKRLATSITKPPFAVFFIKDSWVRILFYVFFMPVLITLPLMFRTILDPSMTQRRFEVMTQVIRSDFRMDLSIEDGILNGASDVTATFDFFTLQIKERSSTGQSVSIIFEEEDLVFSFQNFEFGRKSYVELGIADYSFSDISIENARILGSAIRTLYNEIGTFGISDITIGYLYGLIDYMLYVILMAFIMMFFSRDLAFSFPERLKISAYLTSIYAVSQMFLSLISVSGFEIVSIVLLYAYHLWAFRNIHSVREETNR